MKKQLEFKKLALWSLMIMVMLLGPYVGLGSGVFVETEAATNLAPSISSVSAPTVLQTGATGTWKVNASDPENGNLTYAVEWGDENIVMSLSKLLFEREFVQESTSTHAYAKAGKYTVKFTVSDEGGKKSTSSVTVMVKGPSVVTPPVISDLKVKSIKEDKATLRWKTDVKADSMVWYSTTSPVDTSEDPDISRSAKVKNHKIKLTSLEEGTTYYAVVKSSNNGGSDISEEISFTTKDDDSDDDDAPIIHGISGPTTAEAGEEITVTVDASDPNNGTLIYSAEWGDEVSMMSRMLSSLTEEKFVQTATLSHTYESEGVYTANFTVENSSGQKTSSSLVITITPSTKDTTAPVIAPHENITVESTSNLGAVVNYDSPVVTDNVDDDSEATCAPISGTMFAIGETTVICNATDLSGNVATETSFKVIVTDATGPTITDVQVSSVGADTATVSWKTDESSTGELFHTTITPVDIDADTTISLTSDTPGTSHSLLVTGLVASTQYYFVIEASDNLDNATTSLEASFTTSPGL